MQPKKVLVLISNVPHSLQLIIGLMDQERGMLLNATYVMANKNVQFLLQIHPDEMAYIEVL